MEQDHLTNNTGNVPPPSAGFGSVRNDAESFREIPNASEAFGRIQNDSAPFGNVPHVSERKENHTLTVREVARMFEAAGVARTERSITNWCQPNRSAIARLDAYFDPNERRYFITRESAELAIQEEKAKAVKGSPNPSELFGTVPNEQEKVRKNDESASEEDASRIKELERKVQDLDMNNRVKDYFIERFKEEREEFAQERQGYVAELMRTHKRVGELETKLLQLGAPQQGDHNPSRTD